MLKGPRAALYGRGEPGGTVNLVTKRPTFKTAGELPPLRRPVSRPYRADVDWTAPLSDAVAVRLIGFAEDAGSFRDTVRNPEARHQPIVGLAPQPAKPAGL